MQNTSGARSNLTTPLFDQKGSAISGGFKAPGHEGLKQSIERIELMLNQYIDGAEAKVFKSIIAYDIFMHVSDAVLSGGVRRSAYEYPDGC
jgi:ribonucleoside-diphosphate reductase alpha chain